MKKLSKSPLFTLNNVHYLCTEVYYSCSTYTQENFQDYQFEDYSPEEVSATLPLEIQKQIKSLGDYYYTIAIIPHEKVSDFSSKLKSSLKEKLEEIIKLQHIGYNDLFNNIPNLFQNLATLQEIDTSLKLDDLLQLVTEIDSLPIKRLSAHDNKPIKEFSSQTLYQSIILF